MIRFPAPSLRLPHPRRVRAVLLVAAVGLRPGSVLAQAGEGPDVEEREAALHAPLFASHDPIEAVLRTDVDRVKDERGDAFEEQPAVLVYRTPGGDSVALEIAVDIRGNFRRERANCNFPPLRLDIVTGRARGTLFEVQDDLKLVTPCHDGRDAYERFVLREYLLYRVLNELTPMSFRVRLVRMTYEDTSGEHDPRTRWTFLIEDEGRMAARLGGTVLELPQVQPLRLDAGYTTLISLFQYMIGNTDWSASASHNSVLVRDAEGRLLPVPYDFDFSGAVDATYATPDPRLEIRSVRERVYRGFCLPAGDVEAQVERLNEARARIEALVAGFAPLEEAERDELIEYFGRFYETVNQPARRERQIERACLPIS